MMSDSKTATTAVLAALMLMALAARAAAVEYVWWEGEGAVEHNFTNDAFAPSWLDNPGELSEGDWLHTGGTREGPEVFARWRVNVPEGGAYHFYARKFWHHGPFRWRFDGGEWHTVGRVGLLDSVELRLHIVANWVSLGSVALDAGTHEFEVRLLAGPGQSATAGFDCFLLSPTSFTPRGKLKPGQKTGRAMPGYWAFEPDPDPFTDSPIDLRYLNDDVAGERGFLLRKGDDFVFENDPTPVRFWAVNVGPNVVNLDHASVVYLARKLAKAGVNMARIHGAVYDPGAADPASVDRQYLDRLHYIVHAFKQQGIYSYLSFYFPLWFEVKPEWGFPGFDRIQNNYPFSLLFHHEPMQRIYKSWARGLMTTPNPYTGLSFADDPAVGIYEIINEDNYFFWTFTPGQNIPYECMDELERRFGEWASAKYGSVPEAVQAWDHPVEGDDPPNGRLGLMGMWSLTRQGLDQQPAVRQRAMDQAQFLTEDLRGFYEEMHAWARSELGVKCTIAATNWTTADPVLLGALDKYTNAACEVMDRHGYWGPPTLSERGYMLNVGDRYRDQCSLLVPQDVSIAEMQYDGHVHTVSEYAFPMINRYRTDSVFLGAVYGALQGTDGLFFFAVGEPDWLGQLKKFPLMAPAVLGHFPAAALCYRRGDVAQARTVVRQVLDLADLYALKGSALAEPQNIDNLRAVEVPEDGQAAGVPVATIDPLAYYVGRVATAFAHSGAEPLLTDLSPYIDRAARTVRSANGQAFWDYGVGYATVNTPRNQGAAGLLGKAGKIELDGVVIESGNEYASIMVAALDDEPIASAAAVLVQVMTEETNYGWRDEPDGDMKRVTALGSPPLNVKKIAGRITLRRPGAASLKVTALGPNGYPLDRQVKAQGAGDMLTFTLEPDVIYYVVRSK